jgi:hypothetical protein
VKEKVAESAQDYNRKGVLFQSHHPRSILRGGAMQQHTATTAASAAYACPATVGEMNALFLEAQPTTSTESVSSGF